MTMNNVGCSLFKITAHPKIGAFVRLLNQNGSGAGNQAGKKDQVVRHVEDDAVPNRCRFNPSF